MAGGVVNREGMGAGGGAAAKSAHPQARVNGPSKGVVIREGDARTAAPMAGTKSLQLNDIKGEFKHGTTTVSCKPVNDVQSRAVKWNVGRQATNTSLTKGSNGDSGK